MLWRGYDMHPMAVSFMAAILARFSMCFFMIEAGGPGS